MRFVKTVKCGIDITTCTYMGVIINADEPTTFGNRFSLTSKCGKNIEIVNAYAENYARVIIMHDTDTETPLEDVRVKLVSVQEDWHLKWYGWIDDIRLKKYDEWFTFFEGEPKNCVGRHLAQNPDSSQDLRFEYERMFPPTLPPT